jgi:hypothetical protein
MKDLYQPNFNETSQDNPRKTKIQFYNTKIWYVFIQKNQENIQETLSQH